MVRIRQAVLHDAGVLTELRCAFLEEELRQQLPDGFADQLRGWIEEAMPEGRLLAWLAEVEGRAAGCVSSSGFSQRCCGSAAGEKSQNAVNELMVPVTPKTVLFPRVYTVAPASLLTPMAKVPL